MFASVVAGVKSLDLSTKGFFLMPADIPLVKGSTLDLLTEVYQTSGQGVVYPCYQGRRGHPPLIPTSYVNNILAWDRPGGMKTFLANYRNQAIDVVVDDPGIHMDMDTPEQYRQILLHCATSS